MRLHGQRCTDGSRVRPAGRATVTDSVSGRENDGGGGLIFFPRRRRVRRDGAISSQRLRPRGNSRVSCRRDDVGVVLLVIIVITYYYRRRRRSRRGRFLITER